MLQATNPRRPLQPKLKMLMLHPIVSSSRFGLKSLSLLVSLLSLSSLSLALTTLVALSHHRLAVPALAWLMAIATELALMCRCQH